MIRIRQYGQSVRHLVPVSRIAMAVAGVALVVASAASVQAATTVTLRPAADTYVYASAAGANYGTSTSLHVDGSPTMVSYLRFDLRGTSGSVSRAVLQLYANSANTAGVSVHPVANTTWSETSMTFSNRPALGSATAASGAVKAGAVFNVDVTAFVKTGTLVSLGVTDNNATQVSLASRESAHAPVLAVTLAGSTPPPTSTPRPTATPPPTSTPRPTATPTTAPTSAPTTPPSGAFPVRAAFYYPWFPEAWNQQGMNPFTKYHPSLGFYNGADPAVVGQQIKAMQYGKIQVGIASWWGQGSATDQKMNMLLSTASGTAFKWAVYFEMEGSSDPSSASIASDLAYINSHYGSNPNFYRVNGKPVIFVYAQPGDACGMVSRWSAANASGADYVVLKVFPGYLSCAGQPNGWHQYSPAVAEDHQAGYSFTVAPGFNKANEPTRLARDLTRWQQNVRDMVASHEPWQLVTTFNEWGEGTSVESATEWATASGYGAYLDVLHNN